MHTDKKADNTAKKVDPPLYDGAVSPVLAHGHGYASVTAPVCDIVTKRPTGLGLISAFAVAFALFMVMIYSFTVLVLRGTGIWGINMPVAWGFAIINFVWWIGIGHAGTLISAILLLFKQKWRNSINRFAEAMTLFAVACAGMFPIFHTGRPWLAYYLTPYPNTMGLYPQFRSPLLWDVFAVSTYLLISIVFWYVGLVPDLATLRDRSTNKFGKIAYGIAALGWRGSAAHWHRYETASLLLAALSTPLVLSVHSIVSFDFAVSQVPGWHATIFPPYFVAGAVFAGFAMVLTLVIPIRVIYKLQDFITMRHIDNCAKVMLATGLIVVYGYFMELFMAFFSGNPYEIQMMTNRMFGPMGWAYWVLILCNGLIPQLMWWKKLRLNIPLLFVVTLFVSVGMWFERFVIVVTSLYRSFVPAEWGTYQPTFWDYSTFLGTMGFFMCLLFIFMRVLPMINMWELRELVEPKEKPHAH
ncbi:MAG: polysulfide reductase NrfD [Candidatus Sericytochromatia bacterium]|nr:polysulfide reductase NrfD [Candidatus Sericytochromatia bacterium]